MYVSLRETEQQAFVLDIHMIHICAVISSSKIVCLASVNHMFTLLLTLVFYMTTETMKRLTKFFQVLQEFLSC